MSAETTLALLTSHGLRKVCLHFSYSSGSHTGYKRTRCTPRCIVAVLLCVRTMKRIFCCRNSRQQSCRLRLQSAANSEQTDKKATRQRRKPKETSAPSASSPKRRQKRSGGEEGPSGERPTDAAGEDPGDQPNSQEPVLSEEMSSAQERSQEGAEEVFEGWTPGVFQAVR